MTPIYLLFYSMLWLLIFPILILVALIDSLLHPQNFVPYLKRFTVLLPQASLTSSIWIHAVSVGEAVIGLRLAKEIMVLCNHPIYITCTTDTGYHLLLKHSNPRIQLGFTPYDFPWLITRIIKRIRPKMLLIIETEIWPGIVMNCKQKRIRVCMVNGRIYPGDVKNYQRIRAVIKPVLRQYHRLWMQSQKDVERILALGAFPKDVVNSGNIKLDLSNSLDHKKLEEVQRLFPTDPTYRYLVAASTHSGEEERILAVFKKLKQEYPVFRLILVPRHPDRVMEVTRIISKAGLTYCRKTESDPEKDPVDVDVFLVDTIGELNYFFAIAHLVIMGGTFSQKVGGHNFLEPALLGKPIWVGPYNHNFQDAYASFLEIDGFTVIPSIEVEEIYLALADYFIHTNRYLEKGQRAQYFLSQQQGITKRLAEQCVALLNEAEGIA